MVLSLEATRILGCLVFIVVLINLSCGHAIAQSHHLVASLIMPTPNILQFPPICDLLR